MAEVRGMFRYSSIGIGDGFCEVLIYRLDHCELDLFVEWLKLVTKKYERMADKCAREDAARDTTLQPEISPEPETPFDTPQENK